MANLIVSLKIHLETRFHHFLESSFHADVEYCGLELIREALYSAQDKLPRFSQKISRSGQTIEDKEKLQIRDLFSSLGQSS